MLRLGLGGREGEAVDGGVGVADVAEGVFELDVASVVEGFAEEEDGAAVFGGLVASWSTEKARASRIAAPELPGSRRLNASSITFTSGVKGWRSVGFAVEGYDGDLVGDVADDGFYHGAEVAVGIELAGAGAAGLDGDDKCDRLGAGVFFERELLLYAVIREGEVVGGEGVDELAGVGSHEGRDEDQGRARGEGEGLLLGAGVGVCAQRIEEDINKNASAERNFMMASLVKEYIGHIRKGEVEQFE